MKWFNFRAPQPEKQSHMLDLLDVNLGEASGSSVQTDPWGVPITAPHPRPQVNLNSNLIKNMSCRFLYLCACCMTVTGFIVLSLLRGMS